MRLRMLLWLHRPQELLSWQPMLRSIMIRICVSLLQGVVDSFFSPRSWGKSQELPACSTNGYRSFAATIRQMERRQSFELGVTMRTMHYIGYDSLLMVLGLDRLMLSHSFA